MFADDRAMVGKGYMLETLQFHHTAKEEAGDRHKNISCKTDEAASLE